MEWIRRNQKGLKHPNAQAQTGGRVFVQLLARPDTQSMLLNKWMKE